MKRAIVIEDNGGGLHFVVFSGDNVPIYAASHLELVPEQVQLMLDSIAAGECPIEGRWEGEDDPVAFYAYFNEHKHGWEIVARAWGDGSQATFRKRMGAAAESAFPVK